jgi:hypothetical protein
MEVQQAQDAGFVLQPSFVVLEIEGVDAGLHLQPRLFEPPVDGAVAAGLQFHIGEPFQCGGDAEIAGSRVREGLIQLTAHRR